MAIAPHLSGERNYGLALQRAANLAAAAIIALAFLSLGITAPFSKDQEPQSASWLRDVAEHGHWLVAHDDYGHVIRKPPLYYWLSAIAVRATGGEVDEVNARLVSLLAGAGAAVAAMVWSYEYLGAAAAWLGFFFVLGSYGFASRATEALTDMLLTFLVFAAYCLLYPQIEGRGSILRAMVAGVLLGLGVLTKGPVAIALCALAALIYLLMAGRRPWELLRDSWPWVTLIAAVAIGACWYMPALLAGGKPLFDTHVREENLGHFLPAQLGGTGEAARPFYYITAKLFGGILPLGFLIPALVVALVRGGLRAETRRPVFFQVAWPLAVVIFFSAASGKRDDYILPAIPGLAIAFAALFAPRSITSAETADFSSRLRDWSAALIAIGTAGVCLTALILFRSSASLHLRLGSTDSAYVAAFARGLLAFHAPFVIFLLATALGVFVVLAGVFRGKPLSAGAGLALISVAGVGLFAGTLRPELAQMCTLKGFAAETQRRTAGAPLFVARDIKYGLSFYYGRAVPVWTDRSGAVGPKDVPLYLAASAQEVARFAPKTRQRLKLVIRGASAASDSPLSLYEIEPVQDGR